MGKSISPEQFGEKLKILRKHAKMTQEIFSEEIGIEPQNLSRIERGLNFPSLATFIKISEVLNIKPDELLDVEYIKNSETLDKEITVMLLDRTLKEKRIIYRMLKAFNEV